jgi:hypothetical protein
MSDVIKNMLDNIIDDNQADAQENFADAVSAKITDALNARKIDMAKQMGADHGEVQTD